MEMYSAHIARSEEKVDLVFSIKGKEHLICLTSDSPNEIKIVFNELVKELKVAKYNFTLTEPGDDLFGNICVEYVKQLNSELSSVYGQMRAYGLVKEDA
jgi:hypothetical protein